MLSKMLAGEEKLVSEEMAEVFERDFSEILDALEDESALRK